MRTSPVLKTKFFSLTLYGETTFETLNTFRPATYRLVINKTSIANTLEMANLPPSSEGARQYSYRSIQLASNE